MFLTLASIHSQMRNLLVGGIILLAFIGATWKKVASLPKELHEVSGLTFLNDTLLVAHNDGGDSAKIYILNTNGKIQNHVALNSAANVDFEDITTDGKKYLYLADIGNNSNNRKNLVIYKIPTEGLIKNKTVTAARILFSYPEQSAFPPPKTERYYDAECIAYHNDSLYIFTKCRTEPFDGICKVYQLPCSAGTHKAKLVYSLKIGKRDWYRDAVTGGEFYKNQLFLLTYNRVIAYDLKNGKAIYHSEHGLSLTQKESLTVGPKGLIYIADERHKLLGGGNLYTLKWDLK